MASRTSHIANITFLERTSAVTIATLTDHLLQEVGPEAEEELYSGLRTQDLQEAKDQLLVTNLVITVIHH